MDVRNIPLNAIPSPPDNRDYPLAKLTAEKPEFPEEYETPYPGEVKYQGPIGSCVAHSLAYMREITEARQTGVFKPFSVGYIYGNRKGTLDGTLGREGMIPRDALKNLQRYGDVLYEDFPVNDKYQVVKELIEQNTGYYEKQAEPYRITAYCRLYTTDEIKAAVIELGSVTAMFKIYPSFYKTSKDGVVPNPDPDEQFVGYHQMTILGWRGDRWKVLNSWGADWANKGRCYIKMDFPIVEYWASTDEIVAHAGDFIGEIVPGAIKSYREQGVLPSLTLAQAILESAWGKSTLAKECYNLFGIKWTEGCGYEYKEYPTWEYQNNQWVQVKAQFRKYASYAKSIEDHGKLLLKSRYEKVIAAKDYKEACTEVWKAGYATDPNYPGKLIGLIEKYGLDKYDREGYRMFGDFDKVSDWAKDAVEKLNKLGIMIGDTQGNFNPQQPITREEMAVIIDRLIERKEA